MIQNTELSVSTISRLKIPSYSGDNSGLLVCPTIPVSPPLTLVEVSRLSNTWITCIHTTPNNVRQQTQM